MPVILENWSAQWPPLSTIFTQNFAQVCDTHGENVLKKELPSWYLLGMGVKELGEMRTAAKPLAHHKPLGFDAYLLQTTNAEHTATATDLAEQRLSALEEQQRKQHKGSVIPPLGGHGSAVRNSRSRFNSGFGYGQAHVPQIQIRYPDSNGVFASGHGEDNEDGSPMSCLSQAWEDTRFNTTENADHESIFADAVAFVKGEQNLLDATQWAEAKKQNEKAKDFYHRWDILQAPTEESTQEEKKRYDDDKYGKFKYLICKPLNTVVFGPGTMIRDMCLFHIFGICPFGAKHCRGSHLAFTGEFPCPILGKIAGYLYTKLQLTGEHVQFLGTVYTAWGASCGTIHMKPFEGKTYVECVEIAKLEDRKITPTEGHFKMFENGVCRHPTLRITCHIPQPYVDKRPTISGRKLDKNDLEVVKGVQKALREGVKELHKIQSLESLFRDGPQ